jgi:hypothetical protein
MASSTSAPPCAGGALAVRPMSRPDHLRRGRTRSGAGLLALCLTLIAAAWVAFAPAEAAPQNRGPVRAQATAQVTAQVTADVSGGYARLVFALGDEVDASVHSAGNILIISFDRPVYLAVEHLVTQASQYIARRAAIPTAARFVLRSRARSMSVRSRRRTNSSSISCRKRGRDRRRRCRMRWSRS